MLLTDTPEPRYPLCDIHESAQITRSRFLASLRHRHVLTTARNIAESSLPNEPMQVPHRTALNAAFTAIAGNPTETAITQAIDLCEALNPPLAERIVADTAQAVSRQDQERQAFKVYHQRAYDNELAQASKAAWRRLYREQLRFALWATAGLAVIAAVIAGCAAVLPDNTVGELIGTTIATAVGCPSCWRLAGMIPPTRPRRRCRCLGPTQP